MRIVCLESLLLWILMSLLNSFFFIDQIYRFNNYLARHNTVNETFVFVEKIVILIFLGLPNFKMSTLIFVVIQILLNYVHCSEIIKGYVFYSREVNEIHTHLHLY